jgi:DNA-binding transcriptional LysR family regulator
MIEDVRRFIIFVDLGSVTRAAEKLHITQPALSLSIARLEKELKIALFTHKKKQLAITQQGEQFYRIATKIIELWEKAKQPANYEVNKPIISLGMYDNAALKLANYFQKHLETKQYKLDIKINASSHLLKDISYGTLDIAIAVMDVSDELPKNAVLVNTYEEDLIPVAHKKLVHPLEQLPSSTHTAPRHEDI